MSPECLSSIGVTGIGLISSAGIGSGTCFEALTSGRDLLVELEQPWAAPPHHLAAPVGELDARRWIAPRRLRRLNRFSQLAVIAACEAMEQARLQSPSSAGVIVGTGLGALADTMALLEQLAGPDPGLANPALFPSTVMNVAAAQISMELGLHGYNSTVNQKEISAELAVLIGVDVLQLGHAEALLVGGVDELTPVVHHGYRRLGALARGKPCPYRAGRNGMALGEGAGVLVLEPVERARARGAHVLAEVAGVGAAGGPRPLVGWGPCPESGQLVGPAVDAGVRAVEEALERAELSAADIDFVVGSGCGSPHLDRLEADVLARVFGSRPVPVTSPHGAMGTWMAAGVLRLACAVEALRRGVLFPTITAGEPDPAVPVPGLVLPAMVREASLRTALVSAHAAGGGSVAVVLKREQP